MSMLTPYLSSIFDSLTPPTIWGQDFGLSLADDEIFSLPRPVSLRPSLYLRPLLQFRGNDSGHSSVADSATEFKVNLDVNQFKPEEITVKVVDNYVTIAGKHKERQDAHGYISREFSRRYRLPDDVKKEEVKSELSSDGILTILAPKVEKLPANERAVPIAQTNQPALKGKKEVGEKMDS